jgi:hypothetical protein
MSKSDPTFSGFDIGTNMPWRICRTRRSFAAVSGAGSSARNSSCGAIKCRIGVVANVVTKAMITSIANSGGGMTFRSYPMFSTINSIKPRVFINTPSADESRQLSPVKRAAIVAPPNFPNDATAIISAQISH